MRKYSYILFFILALLSSCVERYFIDENETLSPKIVIDGSINDECEEQEIVISQSSSTDYPKFLPYTDCWVRVNDSDGHVFEFIEDPTRPGHYTCLIDPSYLLIGKKFELEVQTPDGREYKSPYEEMLPCPEIDSLYFKIEQQPTADPNKFLDGVQFYIDFDASNYFGPYYRWILEETYEYHSTWGIKNYYDENSRYVEGPLDFSKFVCYKTEVLNEIMTLSTSALRENSFKGAKLLFVDDHTQRLLYNYRLLVKQESLSEQAYVYWEKIKKNNKSDAGLFTKQPAMIVGNLVNTSDSTEIVLGYFNVTSVTSRSILLKTVKEFSFAEIPQCTPFFFKYTDFPWDPRPLYMFWATDIADNSWSYAWSAPECFDCTLLGGQVEKPIFFN
ncbi:MAG: DUF4249 domain-containing protein [Prolixibacteraceae bacterium]